MSMGGWQDSIAGQIAAMGPGFVGERAPGQFSSTLPSAMQIPATPQVAPAALPASGGGGLAGVSRQLAGGGGIGPVGGSMTGGAAQSTSGLASQLRRGAQASPLLSRLGNARGAAGGGRLAAGGMGRAGVYGIGGQLLGGAIDSAFGDPNASWDNALSGAAKWGGAGAALGSLIAPGIGTAIGGGAGALFGTVRGLMGSRDEGDKAVAQELAKQQERLLRIADQFDVSAEFKDQLTMQLQFGAQEATSKAQVSTLADSILQDPNFAAMAIADRDQMQQRKYQEANRAAVQAWLEPMMRDQMAQNQAYANMHQQAGMAAAGQIQDPAMRAAAQQMARSYSQNASQQNSANLQEFALLQMLQTGTLVPPGQMGQGGAPVDENGMIPTDPRERERLARQLAGR